MAHKTKKNYEIILKEMYRRLYKAFGPQHWWPGETPFEIAVGAILTQNTNWGNVERAIDNLKKLNVLEAERLQKMSDKRLALLIRPAGYFNVKTKRLKEFLNFLITNYRGSMERMKAEDTAVLRERLLSINGIGPETADSILLYALEKPVFVIDAYTRRVLERHQLISSKATYQDIQRIFHENLPRDTGLFNEYHALFVRLGKDFCKSKPDCKRCPLTRFKHSNSL
jgi:endonuclease-3 related protein